MLKRILSSAVLTIIVASVLIAQMYVPFIFTIAMVSLSAVAAHELFGAFGLKDEKTLLYSAFLSAVLIVVTIKTDYLIYSIAIASVMMFVLMLVYFQKVPFTKVLSFYTMSILISISFACGSLLISHKDKTSGIILFALGLLSSWFADIGGYFGGKIFGKHKLCPRISPKKTVEGVIGGFVLSFVCFMLVGLLIQNVFKREISYVSLFLVSLIGTPVSIIGDLTFSVIKRENDIKDYGKVIPGHGGILDRFDGVVFTLPLISIIHNFMPIL